MLVPSPKVATYDQAPEMSADQITAEIEHQLSQKKPDLVVANFANGDMVGHTGSFEATVKAVETLDVCLGKILEAAKLANYHFLITADHGNAEQMQNDAKDGAHTAHTCNPVPLLLASQNCLVDENRQNFNSQKAVSYGLASGGSLADIAPTVLDLMGIPAPPQMTGVSLLK